MHVIVPLAGPDFISINKTIKALIPFRGQPLLNHLLETRPWSSEVISYTFVLFDSPETREFSRNFLLSWYPDCSIVFISHHTRGAALSALSAISTINNFDQPIIVDLADIFYEASISLSNSFALDSALGGIALSFQSKNPLYSYMETDQNGLLIRSAEKAVISCNASAGTYIFRNSSVFLRSVAHALENENSQTYNNLFYVCPLFNGVVNSGLKVKLSSVVNVFDLKVDPLER